MPRSRSRTRSRPPLRRVTEPLALGPAQSLPEVLVGLIMVIGITSTARLNVIATDSGTGALLVAAFSTAVAWALIDAALALLGALFERGRMARLAERLRDVGPGSVAARALVRGMLGARLDPMLAADAGSSAVVVPDARLDEVAAAIAGQRYATRLTRAELRGAAGIVLVVLAATLPPVLPFLFPLDPSFALALSNGIAVLALFVVGVLWAPYTRYARWLAGTVVAAVGLALVGVTVLLDVT